MDHAALFLIFLTGVFRVGSPVFFYVNQNMSWYDAQTYCRTNYIDLATVSSMVEVNSTRDLVAAEAPGYNGSVWLGLRRAWTWATGEPYTGQVPFLPGQPNEGNSGAVCGVISSSGLGDWYCSTWLYFVCYDDSPTATSNFTLVRMATTWMAAEAYCRRYYKELATIKTITDQNIIRSMTGDLYVGIISGQWSDYSFSGFRYWTGVSYSLETSLNNKCVAMVISDSGKWNVFDCALPKPFICYGAPPLQLVPRRYHAVRYLKTWSDAQRYCKARFTNLATVDSIADVYNVMNQVDLTYTGFLWIGLQRAIYTSWCWSSGDLPLSYYYNWAVGKPSGNGQCVSNMNGLWKNIDCQALLYFVCYEEDVGYIRINITKTWPDALSYCRNMYTDLANIRSPWEQSQVNGVVGRWLNVWIGLYLDGWRWSDQWSRYFRNWILVPTWFGTGDCAAVVAGRAGRWTTDNCIARHPFVCYGDGDTLKKKQTVMLKLSSNGMTNLNDPSVQAAILYHIEQKIKANGMNQNVKLSLRLMKEGENGVQEA